MSYGIQLSMVIMYPTFPEPAQIWTYLDANVSSYMYTVTIVVVTKTTRITPGVDAKYNNNTFRILFEHLSYTVTDTPKTAQS